MTGKHLTWDDRQVWYGRLLERFVWELRSGWSSLSFHSRGKRLSLLCRSGKFFCWYCFILKRSTLMQSLQYHPEKNSYTWTDQPGQQILHSKEVNLSFRSITNFSPIFHQFFCSGNPRCPLPLTVRSIPRSQKPSQVPISICGGVRSYLQLRYFLHRWMRPPLRCSLLF